MTLWLWVVPTAQRAWWGVARAHSLAGCGSLEAQHQLLDGDNELRVASLVLSVLHVLPPFERTPAYDKQAAEQHPRYPRGTARLRPLRLSKVSRAHVED